MEVGDVEEEDFEEIECEEKESEEARAPEVLRDPGAPTPKEIEEHNVTHMPFRSWCPHCVAGKAQERPHRKQERQSEKQIPEIVFDYGFLGGKDDEQTLAVQVARDRRTQMLFAHVVPRKGMVHEHGANAMVKDIEKLGYKEVILKCDGEPAMQSVQEEVKRRRVDPTILENSIPGDSRSNGAAERAVKALGEHVRVLRAGLQGRLGLVMKSSHPVMTWLVQHAADCISKYQVNEDGKTAYERLKGKRFNRVAVEFGEKIHYKRSGKGHKEHKIEGKWNEGYFLGFHWRTSEAIVGTKEGAIRAGTIRRVGGHRRWDAEGLEAVRGVPWKWDPDAEDVPDKLLVRMLTDDEKKQLERPEPETGPKTVYRMRLKRDDFIEKGFTDGCLGCKAILEGRGARGHTEACRRRMEELMRNTQEGQDRLKRQTDRENEYLERVLESNDPSKQVNKKARTETGDNSEGGCHNNIAGKRNNEGDDAEGEAKRGKASGDVEVKRLKRDPEGANTQGEEEAKRPKLPGGERPNADPEGDQEMEVSMLERMCQDDFKWNLNNVEDMCEEDAPELRQATADYAYYDENTWEELDPKMVAKGEKDEYDRFCKMGVYEYIGRGEAEKDEMGKFVKVKWVRTKKGAGVRCRLVAQELGYGERLDELFAGTPSLGSVRMALTHAMRKPTHKVMVMDVKCAFLYGEIRRNVYIELPHTDPRYGDASVVGKLRKAMYGTRDAPQIWGEVVRTTMEALGYKQSVFQPAVYYNVAKDVVVVVHVDDFLCAGDGKALRELHEELTKQFEIKQTTVSMNDEQEATYLNRILKITNEGIKIIGDPKHSQLLMKEWGMQEYSKEVSTPSLKELEDQVATGEELTGETATKVRRGIARINYMAQDRPDLSAAAKVMSQHMSKPRDGVVHLLKRCVRYLKKYPILENLIPHGVPADDHDLVVWTDSDWAGDIASRRSTSGGLIVYRGAVLMHWSKMQSNVALSSAEAELNATVKGLSELIGLSNLINETMGVKVHLRLCTDASACKGMLLRHGAGKVKHLSVKQLWSQEVVNFYGIQVSRVARACNAADLLTHAVSFPQTEQQLVRFNACRRKPMQSL